MVETSDYGLDTTVLNLVIQGTSELSVTQQRTARVPWEVGFWDKCWEAELQAPYIDPTYFSFNLFQKQEIYFSEMQDLTFGEQCGGYKHTLEYISGPMSKKASAFLNMYKISLLSNGDFVMKGMAKSPELVGVHTIRIKGTNGARYEYKSVSTDFLVVILDPCYSSVLNSDEQFQVRDLIIPKGETYRQQVFSGPTDSVSLKYGNGYDMCGPRSYTILTPLGGVNTLQQLYLNVFASAKTADSLKMTMTTLEQGKEYTLEMTLRIGLADYPEAKSFDAPFKITHRMCWPDRFRVPRIERQFMEVGDFPYDLFVAFDQSPCEYSIRYNYKIFNGYTKEELAPDFITVIGNLVALSSPEDRHVGIYRVQICGEILQEAICTDFVIQVKERQNGFVTIDPTNQGDMTGIVVIETKRIRVKFGEDLQY